MTYTNIVSGIFNSRPNRFIAHVDINGRTETAHVKNTGRCKELLIPGVTVYLETHDNKARKTKYSLIAVKKGALLVNMDSQAPNHVWGEALASGVKLPGIDEITSVKREAVYGNSRLDFYAECREKEKIRKAYMEVKGVTLEDEGAALFPDAPTERGVKHIRELTRAASCGYLAYIIFIIQMKGVKSFMPNDKTHPEFGDALREAARKGVRVLAYDCWVTPDKIEIGETVSVML